MRKIIKINLFFLIFFCATNFAQVVSVEREQPGSHGLIFTDPTHPLNYSSKEIAEAAQRGGQGLVAAILYDTEKKWAIINDQLYKEGDIVDKCKILTIKPQVVIIKCVDEVKSLPLIEFSVKH